MFNMIDLASGWKVDLILRSRYSKASVSGLTTAAGSSSAINEGAWHEWLTLGARLTIFP